MQFVVIYLYMCNFNGIFQTADYKRKRRILTNGQSYTADFDRHDHLYGGGHFYRRVFREEGEQEL